MTGEEGVPVNMDVDSSVNTSADSMSVTFKKPAMYAFTLQNESVTSSSSQGSTRQSLQNQTLASTISLTEDSFTCRNGPLTKTNEDVLLSETSSTFANIRRPRTKKAKWFVNHHDDTLRANLSKACVSANESILLEKKRSHHVLKEKNYCEVNFDVTESPVSFVEERKVGYLRKSCKKNEKLQDVEFLKAFESFNESMLAKRPRRDRFDKDREDVDCNFTNAYASTENNTLASEILSSQNEDSEISVSISSVEEPSVEPSSTSLEQNASETTTPDNSVSLDESDAEPSPVDASKSMISDNSGLKETNDSGLKQIETSFIRVEGDESKRSVDRNHLDGSISTQLHSTTYTIDRDTSLPLPESSRKCEGLYENESSLKRAESTKETDTALPVVLDNNAERSQVSQSEADCEDKPAASEQREVPELVQFTKRCNSFSSIDSSCSKMCATIEISESTDMQNIEEFEITLVNDAHSQLSFAPFGRAENDSRVSFVTEQTRTGNLKEPEGNLDSRNEITLVAEEAGRARLDVISERQSHEMTEQIRTGDSEEPKENLDGGNEIGLVAEEADLSGSDLIPQRQSHEVTDRTRAGDSEEPKENLDSGNEIGLVAKEADRAGSDLIPQRQSHEVTDQTGTGDSEEPEENLDWKNETGLVAEEAGRARSDLISEKPSHEVTDRTGVGDSEEPEENLDSGNEIGLVAEEAARARSGLIPEKPSHEAGSTSLSRVVNELNQSLEKELSASEKQSHEVGSVSSEANQLLEKESEQSVLEGQSQEAGSTSPMEQDHLQKKIDVLTEQATGELKDKSIRGEGRMSSKITAQALRENELLLSNTEDAHKIEKFLSDESCKMNSFLSVIAEPNESTGSKVDEQLDSRMSNPINSETYTIIADPVNSETYSIIVDKSNESVSLHGSYKTVDLEVAEQNFPIQHESPEDELETNESVLLENNSFVCSDHSDSKISRNESNSLPVEPVDKLRNVTFNITSIVPAPSILVEKSESLVGNSESKLANRNDEIAVSWPIAPCSLECMSEPIAETAAVSPSVPAPTLADSPVFTHDAVSESQANPQALTDGTVSESLPKPRASVNDAASVLLSDPVASANDTASVFLPAPLAPDTVPPRRRSSRLSNRIAKSDEAQPDPKTKTETPVSTASPTDKPQSQKARKSLMFQSPIAAQMSVSSEHDDAEPSRLDDSVPEKTDSVAQSNDSSSKSMLNAELIPPVPPRRSTRSLNKSTNISLFEETIIITPPSKFADSLRGSSRRTHFTVRKSKKSATACESVDRLADELLIASRASSRSASRTSSQSSSSRQSGARSAASSSRRTSTSSKASTTSSRKSTRRRSRNSGSPGDVNEHNQSDDDVFVHPSTINRTKTTHFSTFYQSAAAAKSKTFDDSGTKSLIGKLFAREVSSIVPPSAPPAKKSKRRRRSGKLLAYDDDEPDPSMENLPKKPNFPKFDGYMGDRFYKYLIAKMEAKYGLATNKQVVSLAKFTHETVSEVSLMKTDYHDKVRQLKYALARKQVVRTHHDFWVYCEQYMPLYFQRKAVPALQPCGLPLLAEFDPETVFDPILPAED